MKLTTFLAAGLLLSLAPVASANATIMKEAKAKNPAVSCKTCHSALPGTKANLTDEGKKWVKK
jgi:hypothetical protein